VAADADFRTGWAVVTYDPGQTSPEQIVEAFNSRSLYRARVAPNEGGATASVGKVVLGVPAMTDRASAQRVVQILKPFQEAILNSSLNPGQITVEYDSRRVKAAQILEAINQGTPYRASIKSLVGPEVQPPSGSSSDSYRTER
jgi:copper chaperone CopZ